MKPFLSIAILCLLSALAGCAPRARAASSPEELANAVVRLPSQRVGATVISPQVGRSLMLGCAHAFRGSDRQKPIVVDAPNPAACQPKKVGVRLLAVDYQADLSLIELGDGPLPYVAPAAPVS